MKIKVKILTVAAALCALLIGVPVLAAEPTFREETSATGESESLWFGDNLLLAGNNVIDQTTVKGLFFSFGNKLTLESHSEYAFVGGNTVDFAAEAEKDIFLAGSIVSIAPDAKIGRDVYAAGYSVENRADLSGDFSASANTVVLRDVKIKGNVNLSAATIAFEGKVDIGGTLTYNDDAAVTGSDNVTYGSLNLYTPDSYELNPLGVWFSKLISILGLFLAMLIILIICPNTHRRIGDEDTTGKIGLDLAIGGGVIIFAPILFVLLLLSFIGAPVAIMIALLYIVLIYLSQGFAGLWLGHLIIEKLAHSKGNAFIEALLGIVILGCLAMIPGLNILTGFLAMILGAGLIVRCLKPSKNAQPVASSTTKKSRKA